MTWAEALALFNFIAWLLPIIVRSWIAWRSNNDSRIVLSTEEYISISRAIGKINLGDKKLKIGSDSEGIAGDKK